MKHTHWLILPLVGLLAVACARKNDPQGDSEDAAAVTNVEVQIAKVEQGPIRQMISASGTLAALPDRDVKISALVTGRINQIMAVEGDSVSAGQVVAKLDDSILRDEANQAKAVLENAEANEERLAKLYERGIAAGKEKEDAHRDFVTARAAYDTAALQLARAQIYSPIDGRVVKRFASVGEQVDGTAGQPILEIANFDPIEMLANLPTSYLGSVREGLDVEVRTDAFSDQSFAGKIVAVLPAIDAVTSSATVRIRVPNPDHRLRGGMFATAGIIAATHPAALFVPAAAVVVESEKTKLFVVGTDSKIIEKHVQTGWREGDRVEILQGIQKGDPVVTTGSYGLAAGMKVTVKP